MIINIEAQKSTKQNVLHYHLENRIVYYLSRLISSQKEVEFFHSEYDNIKKVYSIWICMDAHDDQDSISKISLSAETVFGKASDFSELDKMCGIVIRIRAKDNVKESANKLIEMLEDMLRQEESKAKKRKLETKYGMRMTVDLERKVEDMCNLSEVLIEKCIAQERDTVIEHMLKKGKNLEEVVDLTGYDIEKVLAVQEKLLQNV